MILDNHYAVVFRPLGESKRSVEPTKSILSTDAYKHLVALSECGHFVILEAWDITKGKCISN